MSTAVEVLAPPAQQLQAGARIVIGRYRVELVTDPRPVPPRVNAHAEVRLDVRDVDAPHGVWGVTVGAAQRFPQVVAP